jgi:phosphoserine phosphatase
MAYGKFGTVIFDCDSTLSEIEGIEELAREHRAEIEALTDEAMRGAVPLEQVYKRRLDLVKPPRGRIQGLGRRYIETLVPHARETVLQLKTEGVHVRIISGGLRQAVLALGAELGIEEGAVDAVDVYFNEDGSYSGFNEQSPLSMSGGKRTVIESLSAQLPRPIMLVGDGATDVEAKPVIDMFVAFAGVVARTPVVAAGDVVIHEKSLAPIAALALGLHSKH